jgi:ElaB/YqjD/DUF883 family membrane-anchored ribosome-binding protein
MTIKNTTESCAQETSNGVTHLLNESFKKMAGPDADMKQYSDELIEKIKENPLKAVLIAGGVGMLLATLLKK